MSKSIGKQLQEFRLQRKLTQDGLGLMIGYSRSNVSHWENDNGVPDRKTIALIEKVLDCRFEIDEEEDLPQDEVVPPEDNTESPSQPEETPDSPDVVPADNKQILFSSFSQRKVPVWLCAAITCGIFVVMLTITLFMSANYQKQIDVLSKSPVTPYSLAWYQERDVQEDGKAFITITADKNPVKAVPDPGGSDRNMWLYTMSFVEHGGIAFTVNEISLQLFNGNVPREAIAEYAEKIAAEWGENVIPANGVQYWGAGMPVQAISHMGILIKGVDANGNAMEFRGVVEFSQELAE